jgi:hypothetical protein
MPAWRFCPLSQQWKQSDPVVIGQERMTSVVLCQPSTTLSATLGSALAGGRDRMRRKGRLFGLVACVLVVGSAGAQVPVRPVPGVNAPPGTVNRRRRVEPCWQVAGISRSVMEQRRLVQREARQQVEAVCANASLTPEQKREEIRQIRERERQQLEGLITPAQQEALRACQEQRGHAGVAHGGHGHGVGPCGELTRPHPFAEDEEGERPPKEERKPN